MNGRSTERACVAALAAVVAAVPAARADYRIDGHGFGHGVGLAQYGTKGYASAGRRGYRWIVSHYYPGTGLRTVAAGRHVRVRIKELSAVRVAGATLAAAADGRRVSLRSTRTYRFRRGARIACA